MSIKSQPEAVPETRTTLTLNDRMKDYERTYRTNLPANSYVIVRLDGKAFHTFTRGFERPFDLDLMGAMDTAAHTLCEDHHARCSHVLHAVGRNQPAHH